MKKADRKNLINKHINEAKKAKGAGLNLVERNAAIKAANAEAAEVDAKKKAAAKTATNN